MNGLRIPGYAPNGPPNNRMNPPAGGGLATDWRPRSPAAGYAERYAA